ncbi:MAG TPA: flagellar basal body L-ring protein FlgH [Chromatiales bacterium]|nr:flagellar basal body L-ring protein FlgH [Chromatiales bacterium]
MAIRLHTAGVCLAAAVLGGCATPPRPDQPRYAPTRPVQHTAAPPNGSLFRAGYDMRLFEDVKARRVGDILTILLVEKTDAKKKADTKVSKDLDTEFNNPVLLGNPADLAGRDLRFKLEAQREVNGKGESKQSNSLRGSIAVTVAEVLPNGNLVVRGEKWVALNQGEEYIRLSGIVRPEDIGTDNTVPSTRVADARISYGGKGVLADGNSPGWLSRFFLSPLWPF